MKTIRVFLAILIVIGLMLLATQPYWVPRVVDVIINWQTDIVAVVPIVETPAQNATTTKTIVDDWNWVYATTSAMGTQFMYPNPLPTTYVSAVEWPPHVILTIGVLSCAEGDRASHSGEVTTSQQREINDQLYCVSEATQGAAGTTYTQYQYATQHGGYVVSVSFTLKTPQCMNYDDSKQLACVTEQSAFAVDSLVERIIESITIP